MSLKKNGKIKGEWSSKNRDQKSDLSVPSEWYFSVYLGVSPHIISKFIKSILCLKSSDPIKTLTYVLMNNFRPCSKCIWQNKMA